MIVHPPEEVDKSRGTNISPSSDGPYPSLFHIILGNNSRISFLVSNHCDIIMLYHNVVVGQEGISGKEEIYYYRERRQTIVISLRMDLLLYPLFYVHQTH